MNICKYCQTFLIKKLYSILIKIIIKNYQDKLKFVNKLNQMVKFIMNRLLVRFGKKYAQN